MEEGTPRPQSSSWTIEVTSGPALGEAGLPIPVRPASALLQLLPNCLTLKGLLCHGTMFPSCPWCLGAPTHMGIWRQGVGLCAQYSVRREHKDFPA